MFSYISEPASLPEIWPSLVEIKDMKPLPNGGHSNRWVYKMAGVRLEGSSEDIEFIPNQRLVSKTKSWADSTQTWIFEPEDDSTKVTIQGVIYCTQTGIGKVSRGYHRKDERPRRRLNLSEPEG